MRHLERSGRQEAQSSLKATHVLFFLQLVAFLVLVIGRDAGWFRPLVSTLGVGEGASLLARPWALLSYSFLTLHPLEFVVASGILLLAGIAVEERLGRTRFLCLYLLCVALAGLAHAALFGLGLVEGRLFLGALGGAAGLLTAYLFLFGHERRVGSIPFPVVYLVAAGVLFVAASLVDHSNQAEYREARAKCFQDAYRAETPTAEERLDELEKAGLLARDRQDQLGHLVGLVLGALALTLVLLVTRAQERYRVLREIRGLQAEVDARARVELLLEKISRDGIESLSRNERKFLRYASRFYQRLPQIQ